MAKQPSEEFKRDAVRIALSSGLTRRQASADLGIGMSSPWIQVSSAAVDLKAAISAAMASAGVMIRKER